MAEFSAMRNNVLDRPIYGLPFVVQVPLLDADGDPVSPSSPDTEISKNGDTAADCTNELVEISGITGGCYLSLTGTEMTADAVYLECASTGAKTTHMTLYPKKLAQIRSGTAQGGSSTTIQFDSGAVAVDDYYNGMVVSAVLDSTTEVRLITDYVGSTKTATVHVAWISGNPGPDSDDTFIIYQPAESDARVKAAVPDAPPFATNGLAGHTEVAAIKAKTDQLAFGTANRVNAQIYGFENNTITENATSTGWLTELRTYLFGADVAAQFDASGYIKGSSGTGTGQWNLTSGRIAADATHLLGTAWLTPQTAGTPDVNLRLISNSATTLNNLATVFGATHFSVNYDSTNKLWVDTGGTTTLLSRLSAARAGYLDNINNAQLANVPAFPSNFSSLGINASGHVSRVTLADTATNLTNLPTIPANWLTEIRTYLHGADVAGQFDATGYHKVSPGTGTGQVSLSSGNVTLADSSLTTAKLGTFALAKTTNINGFNDLDAAGVRAAIGLAAANLDTQLDAVPTAAENAAGLLDAANGVETGITVRQAMRALTARLVGTFSGAGTGTEVMKSIGGSTTRLTATVDGSGNVTWSLSL